MRIFRILFVLPLLVPLVSNGQGRSPVLKDPAGERSPFYLKIDRSTEELFNAFLLVKKANSGDPVARHELGLRYLTGQAFTPDTGRAALWIGRSAEQEYLPAIYNFGILENNGWGTPWDPFGAFLNIRTAAEGGLVEGMYMYGLLLTDDLVVPRDYAGAYRWIRAAADSGYAFAMEALEDFRKTGILARMLKAGGKPASSKTSGTADANVPGRHPAPAGRVDSASVTGGTPKAPPSAGGPGTPGGTGTPGGPGGPQKRKPALQPVFLDMETDTLADPDDATLIAEALHWREERTAEDTGREKQAVPPPPDSIDTEDLIADMRGTSPEALTIGARRAQMGWGVRADTIEASINYLRAIRCDSRWSPVLLWRLVHTPGYFERLKEAIVGAGGGSAPGGSVDTSAGSAATRAGYLWASLVAMGFDGQLTGEQALGYLRRAASGRDTDALIELALCYYAGYWVVRDAARGDSLMELAAGLGSREAEVRLAMSRLRGSVGGEPEPGLVGKLREWEAAGSVLSQVMLGYCYEEGTGVEADLPVAVSYYRKAAQRGSRVAYDALRRLYDDRRPDEEPFRFPGE